MAEGAGTGGRAARLRAVWRLSFWAAPIALAAAAATLAPAVAERRVPVKPVNSIPMEGRPAVPPIDAAAPSRTETATFAMG